MSLSHKLWPHDQLGSSKAVRQACGSGSECVGDVQGERDAPSQREWSSSLYCWGGQLECGELPSCRHQGRGVPRQVVLDTPGEIVFAFIAAAPSSCWAGVAEVRRCHRPGTSQQH